jgi:SAM-dependent methyltransferase
MSLQRLKLVSNYLNKHFNDYSLIDIGCRTKDLKSLLINCKKYIGTDLVGGDNVVVCDLEKSLPFGNQKYDIVCALDVLEHLDHIHNAVGEIKRIAKKSIIISLPNMAHWTFRLRFLLKGELSGKYTFHSFPVIDRHRWITNYDQSKDFIRNNFSDYYISFIDIIPERGRTRFISEPIEKILARYFPNTFIYGLIAIIDISKTKFSRNNTHVQKR